MFSRVIWVMSSFQSTRAISVRPSPSRCHGWRGLPWYWRLRSAWGLSQRIFLVIFWSFFYHIIRSPGLVLIALDDSGDCFSRIYFSTKAFFIKDMIFLFAESRKTYTNHMKQFHLPDIRMPDWQNIDWKSPVNTVSALSILGGLVYIFYPDIVIYGAIWSAPCWFLEVFKSLSCIAFLHAGFFSHSQQCHIFLFIGRIIELTHGQKWTWMLWDGRHSLLVCFSFSSQIVPLLRKWLRYGATRCLCTWFL